VATAARQHAAVQDCARPPEGEQPGDASGGDARSGRDLPTGTITFLFTDIEGSTRLAEALADRWPPLLERHRAIIRAALTTHGGLEVQTEGDGFFAAFTSPLAALAAATRAQRDLHSEAWPPDVSIRVRMGLHSGEGSLDSEGLYVGHDVHRAARIGAAGHGGQILVSDTVRALVEGSLPAGVTLRDLGDHRLKDLRPQRLAQAVIEGLPVDFPPLRSIDTRPNNLPQPVTSFIGRQQELAAAADLMAKSRLLTLTGPGGTGKTRLALQLAADAAPDYPDGIWYVALEPLRDPALVLPTVGHTLRVLPQAGQPALDAVAGAIGDKRVLLLLDNFEQVIEAAGEVAALLRACPRLTIVLTSRAVLHVAGEQEYAVPGLPAPPDTSRLSRVELEDLPAPVRHPDPATLDQYEAVRLFIARARSVRPDFSVTDQNAPAIAGITARLNGMPLAIELAAARVKLLTPEQILARLEAQLGILTSSARDLPDRQRTLRGAIAWSHELLDDAQRRLLAWLSVFRGGWDLEAAEGVTLPSGGIDVLDGLSDLVDQSLVRRGDDAEVVRFSMLESIREFAAEMLSDAGDVERAEEAHAAVFLGRAEEAARHLLGSEQRIWLDRLERDHDNLRAALARSVARPSRSTAVRLVSALWRFWQQRGYLDEARRSVDRIDREGWQLEPEERARFAEAAGGIAYWQADLTQAAAWYDVALDVRRGQADVADRASRRELANALYNRAYTMVAEIMRARDLRGPPDPAARGMLEEALAIYQEVDDKAGEADLLWGLGGWLLFAGDALGAERHFRHSADLHRATDRRTMEAWSLHMLSSALLFQRRWDEAGEASLHALRHFSSAGDISGIVLSLDVQAVVAVIAGDRIRGGRLWGAARRLQDASGTGLADWDVRIFEMLALSVVDAFSEGELEPVGREGAELTLAEAVAYALGERDPFSG
jgi:predicted ATPase/class 3 adenylate cyclase